MEGNKPNRSFDFFTRKWTLLVMLCIAPVYILFAYFNDPERGLAAYISVAIITVAIRYFWDLRSRVWFWITITFIALLHVLFVLLIRLPDRRWNQVQHWSYMQLLPFGILDLGIAYGIIKLVESVVEKCSQPGPRTLT